MNLIDDFKHLNTTHFSHCTRGQYLREGGGSLWEYPNALQADIHIAKFNVTWNHPTHDVLLTRDEAPLGFVVV